jgi:heat shock protein beta
MWKILLFAVISLALSNAQPETETIAEGEDGIAYTFSSDEQSSITTNAQESEFQAEVSRLMEIIVNSLYKTRDIFLRELISNANDAIDKIRFLSLRDKSVLAGNPDLDIKVQVDPEAGTIIIQDSGIGMTADELAQNLGTVAHSGTAAFLDAFAESGADGNNLIGQFGVGFYSSFLVSDLVTVISKSNDDPKQHIWQSTADGKFTISEDPRGNTLGRGTVVILKIKEDARNFLDANTVETTIQRYSQFIPYPILLYSTRTETEEVEVESDDDDDVSDDELSVSDEEDTGTQTKTIKHEISYWKRINEQKPIWSRRPSQIEDSEYDEFYQALTKDAAPPLSHTHFRAEGEIEFDSILYIPSKAAHQMYDQYYNTKSALRLYVRRVLVADEFEDIVPRYLNFVKGLVDSNDLPLNVNREDLQKSKVMTVISRKLTRKVLDMLRKMAQKDEPDEDEDEDEDADAEDGDDVEAPMDEEEEEEAEEKVGDSDYIKFWGEYGKSIKLGLLEDNRNRKRLMDLLRFTSTHSASPCSLNSYVSRMQPGQKHIYYVSGASMDEVSKSPFLQRFKQRDWEVLYFIDNLDEYLNLQEFEDYPFQSVTKEGVDMDGQKMQDFMSEKEDEFADLSTWLKEIYGGRISRVQLSSSLQEAPMAVGTAKYGASAHMDRITRAQAFSGQAGMRATKILHLNYRHPIVIDLKERIEDGQGEDNEELQDIANLLLDVALIQSGFDIDTNEQSVFSARVHRIVRSGLDIAEDATLQEVPEFFNDVDEEDEEDEDEEEDDDDEEVDEGDLMDDDDDDEEEEEEEEDGADHNEL